MPETRSWVSKDVAGIAVSAIKEMAILSAKVPDAASLAWGLPSFETPSEIRGAVKSALDRDPDVGKYALPDGLPDLRAAVAAEHARRTGINPDADRHVMISAGNMQAMNSLFHVLLDAGDEVIMTDPGFASHFIQIRMCGGTPVAWGLDESRGWSLDVPALEALITSRTKAILLVTPSNPTGSIFGQDDLIAVVETAAKHGIFVLIDDPYSFLTYENSERYFNPASLDAHKDRIAYCFTFSKAYAMSGWRLGYMVLPEAVKREVMKVHDATLICAPRVSQVAALAALQGGRAHIDEFRDILAARRRLICDRLDRVPHVFDYVKPQGAYYVFPRILAEHDNSKEFALRLLHEAKVTVTPGAAFGARGEHHVRMAYCVAEDAINSAFDRIESYLPR